MTFIRKQDYLNLMYDDILENDPVLSNEATRKYWEDVAISEIRSYLKGRFDIEAIFKPIPDWDKLTVYQIDETVFLPDTEKYYRCLKSGRAMQPDKFVDHRPPYWSEADPRVRMIVAITLDMVLYHASSAGTVRDTPTIRDQRYQDAVKWLEKVRSGKTEPDLPLLTDETSGKDISFLETGSNHTRYY